MAAENNTIYIMNPPEGVLRDPGAPPDATALIAVISLLLPLAAVAVVIRLYTRARINLHVAVDDYIMLTAFFFASFVNIDALILLNYGLGKHIWNVPLQPDFFPKFCLHSVISETCFCIASGCAKSSILLFYLRIFPTTGTQKAIWATLFFNVGYSFAGTCVGIFHCDPVAASWNLEAQKSARCVNAPAFYFAYTSLNITSDLLTLAIPIPKLVLLPVPWKQKIAAALALSVGGLVCIASFLRLPSLYALLTKTDRTYNTVPAIVWCLVELNLSITGGCVAVLKPFIRHVFPRLLGSSTPAGESPSNETSAPSDRLGCWTGGGTDNTVEGRSHNISRARLVDMYSEEYIMNNAIIRTVDFEAALQCPRSSLKPSITSSRQ